MIGIDTATAATAVAACRNGETLFSAREGPGASGRPRHASLLLPLVERAAEACGGWGEVERVAVGIGPGTFTGIRIGVVTAKSLAIAHGCGIVGVETTRALGVRAARQARRDAYAVIDAKRGQVFAARVSQTGESVWGPEVLDPAALATRLEGEEFDGPVVGDGVAAYEELRSPVRAQLVEGFGEVDPAAVCGLAAREPAADPLSVMPLYLRRPDAERWIERNG